MPLNEIQGPTNVTIANPSPVDHGTPPGAAKLSGGGYVLTYSASTSGGTDDVVFEIFDALGQSVLSSSIVQSSSEIAPTVAAVQGGFALVWFDTSARAVFTAVFDEQGQQIAAPAPVGTGELSTFQPVVTSLPSGGYAVTWESLSTAGALEINTRVYDALAQPLSAVINVTDTPSLDDRLDNSQGGRPGTVAPLSGGGYVIGWSRDFDVFAAVYNDQGVEIVAPFNLSQPIGSFDGSPQIIGLSTGGFALTWRAGFSFFTAVYDALGAEVAAPVSVGITTADARIVALEGGRYALFWTNGVDAFTAIHDDQGQQVVAPVVVSDAPGNDMPSDVTLLSNGGFALTWENQTGSVGAQTSDVFITVHDAQGQQVAPPINLSNVPGAHEFRPTVTALENGSFLVTWMDGVDVFTAIYQFDSGQTPGDVTVTGSADVLIDLSALVDIGGSVTIAENANAVTIDLSNLVSVGGNLVLSNNGAVLTISLPSLVSVGGDLDISGNDAAEVIDVSSVGTVGGSLSIGDNQAATEINAADLTEVGGDLDISGNDAAEVIDVSSVGTVGGSLSIGDNQAATEINAAGLTEVGGDLNVSGNAAVVTINLGALVEAGGIVIADNGVITLDLSALVTAGGGFELTDNGNLLAVDLPNLTDVGGDFAVAGNTTMFAMSAASLDSVDGDVAVAMVADGTSNTVMLGELDTVGGSVEIDVVNDGTSNTVMLDELDVVGGGVTVRTAPGASAVDAGALGSGGGDVTVTAGAGSATVSLGGLANMDGTLTITSEGGVTITSEAGLDEIVITGSDGDDTVTGSETAGNIIAGGEGNDTLTGGGGDDHVAGGAGDDTIVGGHGGGNDIYDGGDDIDTLIYASTTLGVAVALAAGTASGAEIGNDTLSGIENVTGGSGADRIGGSAADNGLDGGLGDDTVVFSGERGDYTIELIDLHTYRITDNRIGPNDGIDTVSGFESFEFSDMTVAEADILGVALVYGTPGNDLRLDGGEGADLINGFAGHDIIDGKGGADLIIAGAGHDLVVAGSGDDTVVATIDDGNDLYYGESGSDTFDFSQTRAAATVGLGTSVLGFMLNGVGSARGEQLGTDVLLSFENVIGGSGNDTINGDQLANMLAGGAGNDRISGLGGRDVVIGGAGNDFLTGGRGSDTFVFAPEFGADRLLDFDANPSGGQDLLDLTAFGITEADFAERVTITDVGRDLLVTIDGSPDQTIRLVDITNVAVVTQADFLL